jgi:LDH2 family malate/lactate/ureidoglycolate dehydrogenase
MSAASANERRGRDLDPFRQWSRLLLVGAFGGLERRLSTAPFCIGIPRGDAPPVVLDFATSLVAEGKVNVASRAASRCGTR